MLVLVRKQGKRLKKTKYNVFHDGFIIFPFSFCMGQPRSSNYDRFSIYFFCPHGLWIGLLTAAVTQATLRYAEVFFMTANLVISRCCFAENGTGLFISACRTCSTLLVLTRPLKFLINGVVITVLLSMLKLPNSFTPRLSGKFKVTIYSCFGA